MQTYIFYVGRYGSALCTEVIRYDICSVSVFALHVFYVGRYGSALCNEVIRYDICSVSVFALHACNHTYVVSSVTALHETSTTSSHGPANSLMRNSST